MHSLEVYSRKIIIRARSNIVHDILCDVVMKCLGQVIAYFRNVHYFSCTSEFRKQVLGYLR